MKYVLVTLFIPISIAITKNTSGAQTFAPNTVALKRSASPTDSSEKEIRGTVALDKNIEGKLAPGGTLYIFAKKAGMNAGPPMAVLRVVHPEFPVSYILSAANTMLPGVKFEGPFTIHARYSPSGDATDKSGPEGQNTATKTISIGQKDVKIILKSKANH